MTRLFALKFELNGFLLSQAIKVLFTLAARPKVRFLRRRYDNRHNKATMELSDLFEIFEFSFVLAELKKKGTPPIFRLQKYPISNL